MTTPLLNVNRLLSKTRAEGPGLRTCVWVQGCNRRCPGCMASHMWDPSPHQLLSTDGIIDTALAAGSEGLTILGGEPFEQPAALATLLRQAWDAGLSTIVFTGFTHAELQSSTDSDIHAALASTDVLIDGPYIASQRDFSRPLVGSANQQFVFLTHRYSLSDFSHNRIEIRIGRDGTAMANGMGQMEQLLAALSPTNKKKKR